MAASCITQGIVSRGDEGSDGAAHDAGGADVRAHAQRMVEDADRYEMLVLDAFGPLQTRVVSAIIRNDDADELLFRFAVPRLFEAALHREVPGWRLRRLADGYAAEHERGGRWWVNVFDNGARRLDERIHVLDQVVATAAADGIAPPAFADLVTALLAAAGLKDPGYERERTT